MKKTISRSRVGFWGRCALGAMVVTSALLMALSSRQLYLLWPDIILPADFVSFWTGASLLGAHVGADLYDMAIQLGFQTQLRMDLAITSELRSAPGLNPFHSPAPLALIVVPFLVLPMPTAYLVWNALSLAAILEAARWHLHGRSGYLVAMALFPGVLVTLLEGQVNWLFVLALSISLLCMTNGREFSAGLALGLLWLKPQYAVLFAMVLLAKGRWRELTGMGISGAVVAGLFWLLTGMDGIYRYMTVLTKIGTFTPPSGSAIAPESMVNWRGLLTNLQPNLTDTQGGVLVLLLGAATAALLLLIWRGQWDPKSPAFPIQVLATVMATLVAAPHSHFHGTVLLLPVAAMAIARWRQIRLLTGDWPVTLALIGYGVALMSWPFRTLSWLLAVYCAVCMIAALILLRKKPTAGPNSGLPQDTGVATIWVPPGQIQGAQFDSAAPE